MFESIKISAPRKKLRISTAVLESFDKHSDRVGTHDEMREVQSLQLLPSIKEESVREAYERGIEEGNRRAIELLQSQYSSGLDSERAKIRQLFETIGSHLQSQSAVVERALLSFSLGVAEQIIRREVGRDPEILLSIMKDGIRKIVGVEKMRICVNPSDINYVQEHKHSIQSISDSLREITFEIDPTVDQGGCIIESDIGNVDARISTQLDQVKDILTKQS